MDVWVKIEFLPEIVHAVKPTPNANQLEAENPAEERRIAD